MLDAMQAIDSQIAREMQRTPAELEQLGVQKWEPYAKRIELISAFILNSLGEQKVELDSALVLAQAFSKSLQIIAEDLGEEGLGQVRSSYCRMAFDNISRSCQSGLAILRDQRALT